MAIQIDVAEKIDEYLDRAHIMRRAQYLMSAKNHRRHIWLGVPVVLITALIGTAIFGSLKSNPETWVKILAGLLSVSATVLSALQTYLGFGDKASQYKEAGAKYAAIWRSLDISKTKLSIKGESYREETIAHLENIIEKLNEIAKNAPMIDDKSYRIAKLELIEARSERKSKDIAATK